MEHPQQLFPKHFDRNTIAPELGIEKLPPEDKNNIFYTLDNLIKAAKLKAL